MTPTKKQTKHKRRFWIDLVFVLLIFLLLNLFDIGTTIEKMIIILLGLIYVELNRK